MTEFVVLGSNHLWHLAFLSVSSSPCVSFSSTSTHPSPRTYLDYDDFFIITTTLFFFLSIWTLPHLIHSYLLIFFSSFLLPCLPLLSPTCLHLTIFSRLSSPSCDFLDPSLQSSSSFLPPPPPESGHGDCFCAISWVSDTKCFQFSVSAAAQQWEDWKIKSKEDDWGEREQEKSGNKNRYKQTGVEGKTEWPYVHYRSPSLSRPLIYLSTSG